MLTMTRGGVRALACFIVEQAETNLIGDPKIEAIRLLRTFTRLDFHDATNLIEAVYEWRKPALDSIDAVLLRLEGREGR